MSKSFSKQTINGTDYIVNDPNIAPVFLPSVAYSAGEYVKHEGVLYRFTADHPAGAFVQTDCVQVDIGDELSSLKSALNESGLSWNLIPDDYYSGDSLTNNGITFTKNANGSVSSSGTASGQARYYWLYKASVAPGTYKIGGMPEGGSRTSFSIQYAITDGTPASSDYGTAYTEKEITIPAGKLISIRTWYYSGYVDTGHIWNVYLGDSKGVYKGSSNPYNFIPVIYENKQDIELLNDEVTVVKDKTALYEDVLSWKQYNQTGSSTYDYIKCSPRYSYGNTSIYFNQSDEHEQYNIAYYNDMTTAQAGYDAATGLGSPASLGGWATTAKATPTSGKYYILIVRFTTKSADVTDAKDMISFTHCVAKQETEDTGETLRVPVFQNEEANLIDTVTSAKDSDSIIFCAVADPHYNSYDHKDNHQDDWAKREAYIAEKLGADFITVLGDMIEGANDYLSVGNYRQQYINSHRIQKMVDAYTSTGVPFMYVAGHHECFPITEASRAADTLDHGTAFEQNRAFYTSEMKPMVFGVSTLARLNTTKTYAVGHRKLVNKITDIDDPNMNNSTLTVPGATSITYYFDITKNGNTVRFLVVDGTHFTGGGYSPDTVEFVEDALEDAATHSYKVVVMNHIPLRGSEYAATWNNAVNEPAFINALLNSNADIILYLHGHVHADNIVTAETEKGDTGTYPYSDIPFPMVAISCQKTGGATGEYIGNYVSYGIRNVADYSGYCFDTIIINASTGKVDFYRFGAGDSGTYPTRSVN